jgi:membrane-bound serine protease (ClpP class)
MKYKMVRYLLLAVYGSESYNIFMYKLPRRVKIYLLLILLPFIITSVSGLYAYSQSTNSIVLIKINGMINPASSDYIRVGLQKAKESSASALVIEMDTPGGLLNSTKDIVKMILNSDVPVVVYIHPSGSSATSAGVFITLSAHIAAMNEGTSIGAAHPVSIGRRSTDKKKDGDGDDNDKDKDVMNEKIENYASSFIESIAEKRGRNVEWAIEAVRNSASITSTEALEKNVIDLISPSLNDLLTTIDGRKIKVNQKEVILNTKGASIQTVEMSAKQKLINVLSTPDIALLLISLGSLGLLLEFYNPGLIFPGVAGAICLMLGFVSFQILPFNYGGVVLLLIAIGLLIAEIYVPSFGLLTVGGIISFILGALLLFDTPQSDVRVGFDVVIAAASAIGLFFFFVVYSLVKARKLSFSTGYEGMIGEVGDVINSIDGTGKIYVQGEYWDAQSDEIINKGEKVEIIEVVSNMKLKVKKA